MHFFYQLYTSICKFYIYFLGSRNFIKLLNKIFIEVNKMLHIKIDTTNKKLSLFNDSNLIKIYSIAVGKPSTPTPLGNWTIKKKGYGESNLAVILCS